MATIEVETGGGVVLRQQAPLQTATPQQPTKPQAPQHTANTTAIIKTRTPMTIPTMAPVEIEGE